MSGCFDGRFAPSPTGRLHVGNLRTALAAWLVSRSAGARFTVRMEDLDRATSSIEHEAAQLRDLEALGLDWDGPVVRQSDRFALYRDAIATLEQAGLTYECYCSRREIQSAASAPHGPLPEGAYQGTCRELTSRQRVERRAEGRPAALRLRASQTHIAFVDLIAGDCEGAVDDFVLRRNDRVPSYNVAVLIDDVDQKIGVVVRGDDLLTATPRQLLLARLLGLSPPRYAHVPLVHGPDGSRLAKRHGAVTLADTQGTPAELRAVLATSLGLDADTATGRPYELAAAFSLERVPRQPWTFTPSPPRSPDRPHE